MTKNFSAAIAVLLFLFLFSGCGGGGGGGGVWIGDPSDSYLTPDSPPGDSTLIPAPSANLELPTLVIQLEYKDITFNKNALSWSNKIFGTGTDSNGTNRLNGYFREVSVGKFVLSRAIENDDTANDGVVTIRLNKDHPDSGSEITIHPDLKLALLKADESIDFAGYDSNLDGTITPDELIIIFIVAGYEEAYSSAYHPSVWAHQSCVSAQNTPVVDGVTVMGCVQNGDYALFGERHGNHDATIGIIAHELGHAVFGLPDLYNTVDTKFSGIGYFGLMGYGNWGSTYEDINRTERIQGNTPVHFSAWSKIYNGWAAPQENRLQEIHGSSEVVTLYESASDDYNIVKISYTDKEYFLLENRNNSGYDRGLFGLKGNFEGGMAIWHIDENIINARYNANQVNNDVSHKGVDIEEADNSNIDTGYIDKYDPGLGDEKNLFYLENKTVFNNVSSPNSKSYYNESGTGISVSDISARDTYMTATVTNPN